MNSQTLKANLLHALNRLRFSTTHQRAEIAEFRGVGRGRRCFIMGGGPSLKLIDPSLLRGEATFGVNAIYLVQEWLGFLPTYYVVEDKLVVEDRGAEIARMRGPTKFYEPKFNSLIPPDEKTKNINVVADYRPYSNFPYFSRNAARGVWCGGTVTYICLQLAYFMEFDPVYLIGIDHNYVKPASVMTKGQVWTSTENDPNHFHPDYFGKGKRWHDPLVDRMELAYKRAKEEYARVGRSILNATIGGKLEVYPRVDYHQVFKQ